MKFSLFALTFSFLFFACQKSDDGNGNSTVTAVPLPPIDLISNAVSATQINLSWTDKSTNEDGFNIQRKSGIGIFTDIATVGKDVTNYSDNGLTSETTYIYRVYSFNNVGNSPTYSNELSITTGSPTVTDASNNTYPTVTIGTQVWMAENLRTTKYRDGSNIPVVTDNTQWANNYNTGATSPMMCWYNNDQATYTTNKFGALYNWYAINPATNGNKNVCPTGWHVPTDAEWTTLTTFLGGESVAGGKMKSTGTQYWISPNTGATNSSGWSGLPGGLRNDGGTFNDVGSLGGWWSSTEDDAGIVWYRGLVYAIGGVFRLNFNKTDGFSVRCVRD